jgi:hypothetical protein
MMPLVLPSGFKKSVFFNGALDEYAGSNNCGHSIIDMLMIVLRARSMRASVYNNRRNSTQGCCTIFFDDHRIDDDMLY